MKRLCKPEITAIEKFHAKSDKKQKYFSAHQYQNFNIKHLRWSKTDLSKKAKKDSQERYSMNFSSSRPEVYCLKVSLKVPAPVYLQIIKININ